MVKNLTYTQHSAHLATHTNANAVMDFCGSVVQVVHRYREAQILFLLLLPACCGTLEMSIK